MARPAIATAEESHGNRTLKSARDAKQDEFYTQLADVENEIRHYRNQFNGKSVFCNCDDPYESSFFRFFALNFNSLGLRRLVATSYTKSPIAGGYLPLLDMAGLNRNVKGPYAIEINEVPDHDGDGATDLTDVEHLLRHDANTSKPLRSDGIYAAGDFRSEECINYLKEADIVLTNPPFSLFREYIAQLIEYNKKFLIIGNKNSVTYKEVFPLIKSNQIWAGVRSFSGGMWFISDYIGKYQRIVGGVKQINVPAIWLTNMENRKRKELIPLFKKYNEQEYPFYDNYNAIEVAKTSEIPIDWYGAMGVPITFIDKYNPDQFEILGITDRDDNSGLKTREYSSTVPNHGDLNRRGAIKIGNTYRSTYARLLIKRKS